MSDAAYSLTLSCPDRPGIVHAVSGALAEGGCNITESQQYGSPDTGTFFMRVAMTTTTPLAGLEERLAPVARDFRMQWGLHPEGVKMRTLVMASKSAHCLNDLLFLQRSGTLPIEIPAIVSNHRDLEPLAEFYGIPFHHIPVTSGTVPSGTVPSGTVQSDTVQSDSVQSDSKERAEDELRKVLEGNDIELVVLARYMQVLSNDLCRELSGRAISIHHSFLPSFKGARPYHQAHARGVKLIGATAHYVTADLDEGPIIEQVVIRVDHGRSAEQLAAMGRDVEGRALAQAVQWHAEHRVLLDGKRTIVFN